MKIKHLGLEHDIKFEVNSSVYSLKEYLFSHKLNTQNIPINEMRLVFGGKVLEDDFELLHYGITSSSEIHFVRVFIGKSSVKKSPEPDVIDPSLMNTPLMKSLTSNPEFLKSVMMSNPQMKEMMEKNPELGEMINDPSFFSQISEISRSPTMMKEMMRNNDRALSNIENIPGGFEALRKMHSSFVDPLYESTGKQGKNDDEKNREMAKRLNVQKIPENKINDQALPNPWSQPTSPKNNAYFPNSQSSRIESNLPVFGFPPSFFPQPNFNQSGTQNNRINITPPTLVAPTSENLEDLKEKFKKELEALHDMGFMDDESNITALLAAGGNVPSAVEYLCSKNN
jgi:hypothetical protein